MTKNDYVGSIFFYGGQLIPRGYMPCHGQILAISSHEALFGFIGADFGGDGRSTFGLPNFACRAQVGAGADADLTPRWTGEEEFGNWPLVQLDVLHMPPHGHTGSFDASDLNNAVESAVQAGSTRVSGTLSCRVGIGNANSPGGGYPAATANASLNPWSTAHNNATTAPIPVRSPGVSALPMETRLRSTTIRVPAMLTGPGEPFAMTGFQPAIGCHHLIAVHGPFPPRG